MWRHDLKPGREIALWADAGYKDDCLFQALLYRIWKVEATEVQELV